MYFLIKINITYSVLYAILTVIKNSNGQYIYLPTLFAYTVHTRPLSFYTLNYDPVELMLREG